MLSPSPTAPGQGNRVSATSSWRWVPESQAHVSGKRVLPGPSASKALGPSTQFRQASSSRVSARHVGPGKGARSPGNQLLSAPAKQPLSSGNRGRHASSSVLQKQHRTFYNVNNHRLSWPAHALTTRPQYGSAVALSTDRGSTQRIDWTSGHTNQPACSRPQGTLIECWDFLKTGWSQSKTN